MLPPEQIQIIGESQVFLDLMDRVSDVAPMERPVLVIGERGTGKELIAARLHFLSRRWDQPFVKTNCAAIPDTLIESELFGYEAGAFTGATRQRAGRFEQADGGTLFLDEIANMTMAAQEKMLRVIEYGEFERVGGNETLQVDIRIVGATNVDLPAAAAEGRFRLDLLDRLAFDVLTVPPLRARAGDVALMAEHFGRNMAKDLGWPAFTGFSPGAGELLLRHDWPGNVRELKNAIERAVYRAASDSDPISEVVLDPFASPWRPEPDAPSNTPVPPKGGTADVAAGDQDWPDGRAPLDLKGVVAAFESGLLAEAFAANRHNQRDTARHLSLTYDQFRHAAKKYGLL